MELTTEVFESQIVVVSIDDLLVQILGRLPPRPLARFKLVSKRWNSLVSDPAFLHNPKPAAGLILQSPFRYFSVGGVSGSYAPLVVRFDKSSTSYKCQLFTSNDQLTGIWRLNIEALNSCNGLLLCGSNDKQVIGSHPRLHYYVCNPTTGNYFTLPKLDWWKRLAGICLAFDPAKLPYYSVACVYRLDHNPMIHECSYEFEVFSSKTGCWRKTGEPFTACGDFRHGVYWKGSLHWICFSDKSIYFNPDDYDDRQTPPKVMPTPPLRHNYFSSHSCHYFGESGGHLNFIQDAYQWGEELIVHEMRNDYSQWFVKYRVDLNLSTITTDRFAVRALVQGEKDEDSFLVFVIGRRMVGYNLVNKTLETICVFEGDEPQCKSYYAPLPRQAYPLPLQYIESICHV